MAEETVAKSQKRYRFQRVRMGVPWVLEFYAVDDDQANRAAQAVFARVKELDQILSDYDPNSELNTLCRNYEVGKAVPISEDLFRVLQFSRGVSCRSRGAFDITVGGITDLWRRAYRKRELPAASKLEEMLKAVGYLHYFTNANRSTVTFRKPDMQLDLGGIAKGYAADEAMKLLNAHGISRGLVDASGDIVLSNAPPEKSGWIVGISPIKDASGEPSEYLELENMSIATSGNASRYVEIEGVRYSHIVNPQTGIGLTTPSRVTVIADNCMTADSLASALSVLPFEAGLELAEKYEASALIVFENEAGIQVHQSKKWPASIKEAQP